MLITKKIVDCFSFYQGRYKNIILASTFLIVSLLWNSAALGSQVGLAFSGNIETPDSSFGSLDFVQGEAFSFSHFFAGNTVGIPDELAISFGNNGNYYITPPVSTIALNVASGTLNRNENSIPGAFPSRDSIKIANNSDADVGSIFDLPFGDVWRFQKTLYQRDFVAPGDFIGVFLFVHLVYNELAIVNDDFFLLGDPQELIHAQFSIVGLNQELPFDPEVSFEIIARGIADLNSVQAIVPIPAGAWLLGSAVLGLVGIRLKS